jgi:anti-sigma factor RsiW
MSDPGRPIAEEKLHAYVDDQLEPDRQSVVLRYLGNTRISRGG